MHNERIYSCYFVHKSVTLIDASIYIAAQQCHQRLSMLHAEINCATVKLLNSSREFVINSTCLGFS